MAKQNTQTKDTIRPFGMRDKIAYAAGDFGCNMSFVLSGTFFTLFYTQYMKINSLAFAGILILLKIWDAINDPLLGAFIDNDRRHYKLGKFRTYIKYGSIGLLIAAACCFLPFPQAPQVIKVILCLVGYICWDAFYTIVNVPYGSMVNLITAKSGERAELSAWRSFGANCANVPINMILPLVLYNEDRQLMGERLIVVALVLGIIGFIAFRFMVNNTVERVQIDYEYKDKPKFNYFTSIKNFASNRPALGATLIPVANFLGSFGAATAITVMFQSYFKNTAVSGISTVLNVVPTLVFLPLIGKIVSKMGKKEAAWRGLILSIIASGLILVIPMPANNTGVAIYFGLIFLSGIGSCIATVTTFAMMADAIDYNEWKHGVREEGTTYALHSFFRKLAQGIGPSLGLVLMVAVGYNETLGANQPWDVACKMRYLVGACYLGSAILQFIAVKFVYNLDRHTLDQMERELGRVIDNDSLIGEDFED